MIEDSEIHAEDADLLKDLLALFAANPTLNIRSESVTTALKQMADKHPTPKSLSLPSKTIEPVKTL